LQFIVLGKFVVAADVLTFGVPFDVGVTVEHLAPHANAGYLAPIANLFWADKAVGPLRLDIVITIV